MKPVLVSQRVDILADRDERRDALDQRLLDWLAASNLLPVPVPNRPERLMTLWECVKPAAIVLSGGNNLVKYGGDAPERDTVEHLLLERAMAERMPVFAICRGAQLVIDTFGASLEPVVGHVHSRHNLWINSHSSTVNSYHQWGCRELKTPLKVLARSEDGVIEAFAHEYLPILGVMWHPERETPFSELDKALLAQCLNQDTLDDTSHHSRRWSR